MRARFFRRIRLAGYPKWEVPSGKQVARKATAHLSRSGRLVALMRIMKNKPGEVVERTMQIRVLNTHDMSIVGEWEWKDLTDGGKCRLIKFNTWDTILLVNQPGQSLNVIHLNGTKGAFHSLLPMPEDCTVFFQGRTIILENRKEKGLFKIELKVDEHTKEISEKSRSVVMECDGRFQKTRVAGRNCEFFTVALPDPLSKGEFITEIRRFDDPSNVQAMMMVEHGFECSIFSRNQKWIFNFLRLEGSMTEMRYVDVWDFQDKTKPVFKKRVMIGAMSNIYHIRLFDSNNVLCFIEWDVSDQRRFKFVDLLSEDTISSQTYHCEFKSHLGSLSLGFDDSELVFSSSKGICVFTDKPDLEGVRMIMDGWARMWGCHDRLMPVSLVKLIHRCIL